MAHDGVLPDHGLGLHGPWRADLVRFKPSTRDEQHGGRELSQRVCSWNKWLSWHTRGCTGSGLAEQAAVAERDTTLHEAGHARESGAHAPLCPTPHSPEGCPV